MTARIQEYDDLTHLRQFVFCTASSTHAHWLGAALREIGMATQERGDALAVVRCLATLGPAIAFIDFSLDEHARDATNLARAVELVKACRASQPQVPLVAVGMASQPEGTLAALRAGVRDFIDLNASDAEIREVIERVTGSPNPLPAAHARGKRVVVLGARVGVGSTTLATHLASIACQRVETTAQAQPATRKNPGADGARGTQDGNRVVLLDLGLPAGDGLLYLNESGGFHFAEAVRNLSRFDETLVNTAFTRSSHGATVLSLPRDLAEMRMISHADSLGLMNQLRRYFDLLITDLGGFSSFEFVSNMVREADETWLVTDQSIGSVVSLADLMNDLKEKKIPLDKLRLVVNRYDTRYGMAATQIAERFSLELAGTLPDRALQLISHANVGKLLVKVAEQDPYVRAVRLLAQRLLLPSEPVSVGRRGLAGLGKLIAGRSGA